MKDKSQHEKQGKLSDIFRRRDDTVSVNLDRLKEEDKSTILDTMATQTGFTKYEGEKVEYGYDLKYTKDHNLCPRCKGDLHQHYADFIYATQDNTRVMFAPAGYFCAKCHTVVIDQEMLKKGVVVNNIYREVLGIEVVKGEVPILFRMWNDKEVIYVVDGERIMMEFKERKNITNQQRSIEKKVSKTRNKKKLEKLSKKKNRRKR